MNEESVSILKQSDPLDWVLTNYAWPKSTYCLVPISQRLLRFKFYENLLTNGARSSTSSDDSHMHNTIVERDQTTSANNQQLVSF